MKKMLGIIGLFVIFLLSNIVHVSADVINNTADTYVDMVSSTTSFEGADYLFVSRNYNDKTVDNLRIYELFDFSDVETEILSWSLTHTVYSVGVQTGLNSGGDVINQTVQFYFCNDTFTASTLTWSNQDTEVMGCYQSPFYEESIWTIPQTINATYTISGFNLSDELEADSDKQFTILARMKYEDIQHDADTNYWWARESVIYTPYFDVILAEPSCAPDWSCTGYGECVNELQSCNAVSDLNVCGGSYTGDYSEFTPQACSESPFTYDENDLAPATINTIGKALITIARFATMITMLFILVWFGGKLGWQKLVGKK